MEGTRTSKNVKKRLNMMVAFLGIVYLPFLVSLSARYDILNDSLSRIGWQLDGLKFLILYVLFTVPLLVSQITTFQIMTDKKTLLLKP